METYVSRATAARMLDLAPKSFDAVARRNHLERFKVGGTHTVRYRLADVEALVTPAAEGETDPEQR